MHRTTRFRTGLASFLIFGAAVTAQVAAPVANPSSVGLPQVTAEKVAALVERARAKQSIPGVSVAIGVRGTIVFDRGFGFADLEHRVPTKPETRFRTASIAKPMTAVGVMQLVEKGAIELDAPIRTYVPKYPEKRWPISVEALLGHLGGVRHYQRAGESNGTRRYRSLTASLRCFAGDPLLHEPGSKYRYTTYGYTLLGCAIEHASNQSFENYMREQVWKPAGMTATCLDAEDRIVPDRARGYRLRSIKAPDGSSVKTVIPAALADTSMKIPGGGLRSTAGDLVRFAQAMLDGRLVSPKVRSRMWTSLQTTAGKRTGYGLGFSLGKLGDEQTVGHSGGQAGTACRLRILPKRQIAVAVMTNLEKAKLQPLMIEIMTIVADGE